MRTPPAELQEIFDLLREPEVSPRYNIAPTQEALVIRLSDGGREPVKMRWGLIPSWAQDEKFGYRSFNARSEKLAEPRSMFRPAFKSRRCLVPADGLFEWKKTEKRVPGKRKGTTKKVIEKQPYYFKLRDGRPFAFAGLWETWRDVETYTIITAGPNELMKPLHDRMAVILKREHYGLWLDPEADADALAELLVPFPANQMTRHPVSRIVNDAKNDVPECIEEMET